MHEENEDLHKVFCGVLYKEKNTEQKAQKCVSDQTITYIQIVFTHIGTEVKLGSD